MTSRGSDTLRPLSPRRVGLTLPLSVWLSGCGLDPVAPVVAEETVPQQLASAVCRAEHDCECPTPRWPDRDTCLEIERTAREDIAALAAKEGLLYDGACAARLLDRYDVAGCDVEVDPALTRASCRIYVGPAEAGDACERLGITFALDTCGQGLRCEADRCVPRCDPAEALPEGARCRAGVQALGEGEQGLYCAVESELCAPAPGAGEPCPDQVCADTAFCDRSDPEAFVCVARRSAEEPCLNGIECLSARCVGGECAPEAAAACSFREPEAP